MLSCIYGIVSVYVMQVISWHLEETGEDIHGDMKDMFPTVARSMLTLFEASTGGEDWAVARRAIWPTGWMGTAVYLTFIAFVQFALINIITGIFVQSAKNALSPDSETLALELLRKEADLAEELATLCRLANVNYSGKLSPNEFQDGLRQGRIPLLLAVLGVERHQVEELFDTMSNAAESDDGHVDISDFVDSCMKLRGGARNYDIQIMRAEWRAAFGEIRAMHKGTLASVAKLLNILDTGNAPTSSV